MPCKYIGHDIDAEDMYLTNLVLSYVYSKQPIFVLTQEWFIRELSFCRLEWGVHDKFLISSTDWWDILLHLA